VLSFLAVVGLSTFFVDMYLAAAFANSLLVGILVLLKIKQR
jgi:hypothetical protein